VGSVDEVKQKLDIVDVVSDYVPGLTKTGKYFKAPCPFHAEKDPSFYVFPERQSWHCFGACHTGGDMFSFVMRKEGVDFGEALRILAHRAGVSLVPPQRSESQRQEERLKDINQSAADFFHRLLLHPTKGQQARQYLERRGLSQDTIERFQLGLSPDGWEVLREHLSKKGYRDEELLAAGLLVSKDYGRPYDRFRNRLMFPIRGTDGKVTGFGARALDDSLPKYLNSPQTAIFDKSATLYGIDRARYEIRTQDLVVVVEGYMDAIVAHQHGFTNVVASLGTALTEKQVGLLKKITKNLTLALDADAAGQVATMRGIDIAATTFDRRAVPIPTSSGLVRYESILDAEIRVMVLPAGKDPDDVIRESREDWKTLLDRAVPVVEYTFDVVRSGLDLTKAGDKSRALDQLLPLVAEIRRPVMQAHYLQKLSRIVGVDEKELAEAARKTRQTARQSKGGESVLPSSLVSSVRADDPLADYFLALLFRYPRLRTCTTGLAEDLLPNSESRQLLAAWLEGPDLESVPERIDPTLEDYLSAIVNKPIPDMGEEKQETALDDCLHRLRIRRLSDLKSREEALIANAEAEGNLEELRDLQELGIRLNAELLSSFGQPSRRRASRTIWGEGADDIRQG